MKASIDGTARSNGIGDFLGISRLLSSASYGAHYLGTLLARVFFLSDESGSNISQCLADTFSKFSGISKIYNIDLNTKAIDFMLSPIQFLEN